MKQDKVPCRTPTPGKAATRIDAARFEVLRKAILKVVPLKGEGMLFTDLILEVPKVLTADVLKTIGSVPWNVTTVKLELEVRGELVRVPNSKPQRLLRR